MRISDGSSDVCSSDLRRPRARGERDRRRWPPAVAVVADPGADEPADGAAVAAADDDQLYPHHHRTVDPAPRAGAAADAAEPGARGPQPLPVAVRDEAGHQRRDRKIVVEGKSVSVRVDRGGRSLMKTHK